jgi:hypothetical protein
MSIAKNLPCQRGLLLIPPSKIRVSFQYLLGDSKNIFGTQKHVVVCTQSLFEGHVLIPGVADPCDGQDLPGRQAEKEGVGRNDAGIEQRHVGAIQESTAQLSVF